MPSERYIRFDDCRRPSGARSLLWPVRVWKVLYPAKRVLQVNLFQQAILGLARARCQDRLEIAELLGLDQELVAFIIATQLIPNGWMTELGTLTPNGERVLHETEDTNEDIRLGYAYQDALSGNWLPRFTENLPEIEPAETDADGYPKFLRNKNSGEKDKPFRLNHTGDGELDTALLFDAFQRYRSDLDHAQQRDDSDNLPTRLNIKSLSFIDTTPQPMWVWTWVFPDEAGAQPWLVADPFGLQYAASWLRKPLQGILLKHDGLARYISSVLKEEAPTEITAEEWLRSLESRTDLEIMAEYPWARKYPVIEGYLASVLRRKDYISNQDKPLQEDVTSLLIETHNLAESVLQWIVKTYPLDIRRLPKKYDQKNWKDQEEAKNYLGNLKLSFLTEEIIKILSYQTLDQVRSAAKQHSGAPKALLFAALLGTIDQENHPFKGLTTDEIQLDILLKMTDARNKKAGHAGKYKIGKVEAIEYAEFIIEWVKIFRSWY